MSNEVDIALLEQYLAGEITEDAVLHTDGTPVSKDQLEEAIQELNEVVLNLEGAALKSHLQEVHATINSNKKHSNSQRWLAIAATVVLIAAFLTILWQRNSSSPEFGDYFDHFAQLETFRDSDSVNYSAGLEAYSKLDYLKAYELLSSIENLSYELRFYEALSALGSGKTETAISVFNELGIHSSGKYYQQIRWYLALAYWRIGKLQEAKRLWKSVPENEFKHQESQELLDLLSH